MGERFVAILDDGCPILVGDLEFTFVKTVLCILFREDDDDGILIGRKVLKNPNCVFFVAHGAYCTKLGVCGQGEIETIPCVDHLCHFLWSDRSGIIFAVHSLGIKMADDATSLVPFCHCKAVLTLKMLHLIVEIPNLVAHGVDGSECGLKIGKSCLTEKLAVVVAHGAYCTKVVRGCQDTLFKEYT